MPLRPPAPPHAGCIAGVPVDRPGDVPARAGTGRAQTAVAAGPAVADPRRIATRHPTAPTHPDPSGRGARRALDRRTALRLAGGGAVGALALTAVAGCADEPIYLPDPLAAQESSARADAAAATAAIALAPQRQVALAAIAAQRNEHAAALLAEVQRVIGVYGDGTTPVHRTADPNAPATAPGRAPTPGDTPQAPVAPPSLDQLREQLTRSQQSAADLARTQSGYRAGLLASISAACATQTGVLLA